MEDFIRPNKDKKPNSKKRKLFFDKQILIILVIIISLGIGFGAGFYTRGKTSLKSSNSETTTIFNEIYNTLVNEWVNTTGKDINIAQAGLKAFVSGLGDIHSSLFTAKEASDYNDAVDGDIYGIGITFIPVSQGIMITKAFADTPANNAGLAAGDLITKIGDEDIKGLSVAKIKSLITGAAGTNIKLTYIHEGKESEKEITREKIDTSLFSKIIKEKNLGYVQINTFGSGTASKMKETLEKFQEQNISNIVLDVRNNGGGYLNAAIDILDLFLDTDDIIYQMKTKDSSIRATYAKSDSKFTFNKGYVLINGNTASASEITAAALQENLNYQLIGTKTYGKGSAQAQKTLSNGSVLKYTYATWYTPKGKSINDKGIKPDVEVTNKIEIKSINTDKIKTKITVDSVSKKVAFMQKALTALGYTCDRNDGYFSSASQEQLIKYQQTMGISNNGEYDETSHLRLISSLLINIGAESNDNQYQHVLNSL